MRNKLYIYSAAIGILGLLCPSASASMELTLTSGGTTVTVNDNGVGDADSTTDVVAFIGNVGNWHIVATGTVGTNPLIDLNAVVSLNTLPGTGTNALTLQFSATDFANPSSTNLIGQIGGTVGNGQALSYSTYLNANDLLNATQTLIGGTTMSFTPGSFEGTTIGSLSGPSELVSLTQIVTVSGSQKGLTSFNGAVDATVPEPAAMVMLGTMLLMAGPLMRKKLHRA